MQQYLSCLGAGLAHGVVVAVGGAAADSEHEFSTRCPARGAVDLGDLRREFNLHLPPVGVHFLGKEQGKGGHGALSHLGCRVADHQSAVFRDLHPGVYRVFCQGFLQFFAVPAGDKLGEQPGGPDQKGHAPGSFQEFSAADGVGCFLHGFRHRFGFGFRRPARPP